MRRSLTASQARHSRTTPHPSRLTRISLIVGSILLPLFPSSTASSSTLFRHHPSRHDTEFPSTTHTLPPTPPSCFDGAAPQQGGGWDGAALDAIWVPASFSCRNAAPGLAPPASGSAGGPDLVLDPRCLACSPWTLLVGDSNMRKLFVALVTRLERQHGLVFTFITGRLSSRWSDREAIHLRGSRGNGGGGDVPSFRLSFYFIRSAKEFEHHMVRKVTGRETRTRTRRSRSNSTAGELSSTAAAAKSAAKSSTSWRFDFSHDYELDGTRERDQRRPEATAALDMSGSGTGNLDAPSTVLFSTGLWERNTTAMAGILEGLEHLAQSKRTRVLYLTAGMIGSHPQIDNGAVKRLRDFAVEWHDRRRQQLREQGQSSEGMVHEQLRLKLFDLWPLTASAEVDWISRDGGFHYTSQCDCIHPELCTAGENTMGGPDACDVRRQQTPVTRAVLRGMWAFVCGG